MTAIQNKSTFKKTDSNGGYETVDYVSLLNLGQKDKKRTLIPGFTEPKNLVKKKKPIQRQEIQQPQLLKSAKFRIQSDRQKDVELSQTEQSNKFGLSSFISRQNTPINPLNIRKGKSGKNKLTSVGSQLFEIASNPQQKHIEKTNQSQLRIQQCFIGQTDVVYKYVFGKQRALPGNILQQWKECLSHEDMAEIYLPVGDVQPDIPYSHARIYPLNQIQRGLRTVLGTGKNRALTIGQQASVIESIERYLELAKRQPLKIGRKDFDIIADILKDCKLQEIESFPKALKQVEAHFKLMATKWRYSGQLNMNDKILEAALSMGKNNFLDLSKHNVLIQFLLGHSNIKQI